jgi:hypothetical protein
MAQKRKPSKKKPAAKRPQRKRPAKQKIQPVEEILFRVEGKMSTFGGPRDTGMSADEGLALFTPADLKDPKYSYLFLPTRRQAQPDLGGGLTPKILFCLPLELQRHAKGIFEACACTRGEPCKWARSRCAAGWLGSEYFDGPRGGFVSGISESARVTDGWFRSNNDLSIASDTGETRETCKPVKRAAPAIQPSAPTKPVGQAVRPGALTNLDRFLGRG